MRSGRELLAAWSAGDDGPRPELEGRYRPVLQAFGRRVGVEEADLEPACDAALDGFFEDARRAPLDPRLTTHERLFAQARACLAEASLSASDLLQSDQALLEAWDAEWRAGLVRGSIQALVQRSGADSRMLQAYDLHVIEKRPAAEVARELGMTHTAVHSARHLVLGMLGETLERMKNEF